MVFVRMKTIKGKQYAYLVENKWKQSRVKQQVKQYLGRVLEPREFKAMQFEEFLGEDLAGYLERQSFSAIVQALKGWELAKHGYSERDYDRKSVFAFNDGFLCHHHMKKIYHFQAREDERETGMMLAEAFVQAGIAVPKEVFVALFEKING